MLLYAASMPLQVAAEFSNAECMKGTFHAEYGNIVVETSRQPVAHVTTTGLPSVAMSTCLATVPAPQPAQSRWPPVN